MEIMIYFSRQTCIHGHAHSIVYETSSSKLSLNLWYSDLTVIHIVSTVFI